MGSTSQDAERELTIAELPDDPMQMPPPYWRSSGACFHIHNALIEIDRRLKRLAPALERIDAELEIFYRKYPTDSAQEKAEDEYWKIISRGHDIEHRIKLSSQVACLMSAIEAEDSVNCFCVYNLHRHIAEGIERLPLPDKLVVACAAIGVMDAKGTSAYEAARKLTTWRNAFAHGHCVDRPTRTLRHNHLVKPPEYPGVPSAVRDAITYVQACLTIADYLKTRSRNPYLRGQNLNDEDNRQMIARLKGYSFKGSNWVYEMRVPATTSARRGRQK